VAALALATPYPPPIASPLSLSVFSHGQNIFPTASLRDEFSSNQHALRPTPAHHPPPHPPQDGKRQSAYQAKMHLATLARKVKAADAAVGCPGHERIFALLHTVEGVLADLKGQEAAAAAASAST